jgi:hypothetical protein
VGDKLLTQAYQIDFKEMFAILKKWNNGYPIRAIEIITHEESYKLAFHMRQELGD